MKQFINEVKRMQQLAGLINENKISINLEVYASMMKKYDRDLNSYPAETMKMALEKAIASGLIGDTINQFSSLIRSAPKRKIKVSNAYNKYTPIGQMTAPNNEYKTQLQAWKVDHVYPFFLAFGFDKSAINTAWKELISFKSWK